jgi:hypothetical protein
MENDQDNKKKTIFRMLLKSILGKILATITILGTIVGIIYQSIHLYDRMQDKKTSFLDDKNVAMIDTVVSPGIKPVAKFSNHIAPRKEIQALVEEARRLRKISATESLHKFKQAYELLPEKQKNAMIRSNEYVSTETQANIYDKFFKELKY